MKLTFGILFLFVAVQLSESFLFNRATPRPTPRPWSRRPWGVYESGPVEAYESEDYFLNNVREFVEKNFLTPFVEKVLKPLENKIFRPLEENIKQKLSDLKLNTLPKVKKFFQDTVIAPTERAFATLKEKVHQYIETFGKLVSKESRDQYKKRISELIDTKLRQPLLERVKKLLKKVEDQLEKSPEVEKEEETYAEVEPYYFDAMKNFIESNIVTPFVNRVVKPIEDKVIRPLEQNFKQKLSDLQLTTIPQVKNFFNEYVVTPIEDGFNSLKDTIHKYIETFGVLISKESRDRYKQQFSEFVDTKIRLPILERVKVLLEKVENQLDN